MLVRGISALHGWYDRQPAMSKEQVAETIEQVLEQREKERLRKQLKIFYVD
jgi:hypothetical protein